jgi:AcrR family transcriptional regulator
MRKSTPRAGKSGRPVKRAAPGGRPPRKAGSAYHHGDLRHAMLVAAGALIEEAGVDGLSLRECARRAGVSHGAPAHHFGDVRGLLTALAAQSFEMLVAVMDRYEAAAAPEAYAQLIANGQAYVAFALAHPGRFRLMFRSEWVDRDDAALQTAGGAAYGRLQRHIAAVVASAGADAPGQDAKAAFAWAIVHGLASLALDSQLCGQDAAHRAPQAAALMQAFATLMRPGIEGRAAMGPKSASVKTTKARRGL